MTQRQLAVVSGIPQGKISRIERGATEAPVSTLAKLAEAVGMSLHLVIEPRPEEKDAGSSAVSAENDPIHF